MPDGFMWRLMDAAGATIADLIILLLLILLATAVFYMHSIARKDMERLRAENNAKLDRLWSEVRELHERYHRLDALSFAMAKVLEMAKTGKAKIVRESANGDGDYTLNRKY